MGLTANVVPDELIESAWGNEIRDRTVQVFANASELLAQWPTANNGSSAILLDGLSIGNPSGRIARRIAGQWVYCEPWFCTHAESISASAGKNFTAGFGTTFLNPPEVVVGSILVGANLDFVLNWQGVATATGIPARLFRPAGTNVTGTVTIQMVAFGKRLVV